MHLHPMFVNSLQSIFLFSGASSTTNTFLTTMRSKGSCNDNESPPSSSDPWSLFWEWLFCLLRASAESARTTGSSTVKVAPVPWPSDVALMIPPCRFTMPLAIHSPNPLPPPPCSLLALNCIPSRNSCLRLSADNPAPESLTEISTDPAGSKLVSEMSSMASLPASSSRSLCHTCLISTEVPLKLNFNALLTTLRNTCASLSESPMTRSPSASGSLSSNMFITSPFSLAWM
mmetsp:Transcript_21450/g.30739  ORF Transcript_21450/g.30739 Transcript_21450/m.30739 type:complete len:231 (+) Transcript_21450:568-1260(+)